LKIADNSAFNPLNPRIVTYYRDAANVALRLSRKCGFMFSVALSSKRLCPCTWKTLRA